MHATATLLLSVCLGFLGLAAAPEPAAPDPQAEIQACLGTCDGSDDETDRVTCRLTCYQATEGKDDVRVTTWKKERHLGGTVPGQDAPPPPVTTVTTTTARGTTTVTTTTDAATPVHRPTLPPPVVESPRRKYYLGLTDCQGRCDATREDSPRARCKLRCLRLQPGPPPAKVASAVGSTAAPARSRLAG